MLKHSVLYRAYIFVLLENIGRQTATRIGLHDQNVNVISTSSSSLSVNIVILA